MATSSIFEEDEVYRFTEKGTLTCGLVVESSEYISSDEDDEEAAPYYERIKKGSVRVVWHPEGEEEVIPEKNVKLADRSLMPGDVVRRLIEGEDSQRGYVRNTTVNCCLQLTGKNKVVTNVESGKLQPQIQWEADQESGDVFLDSWVGRIEAVVDNITFKLPDGARCQLNDEDHFNELCQLEDLLDKRDTDSEFYNSNFYKGEKLKGTLSLLEPAKWLKTTKAHSPHAAKKNGYKEIVLTVEETEAKSIEVHWLCRGFAKAMEPCGSMTAPPRVLKKDDIARLQKLDCFEACQAQIGDKAFYAITEQDRVQTITPKGNRPLVHYVLNGEKTGDGKLTISSNSTNQKKEEEEEEEDKAAKGDSQENKSPPTADQNIMLNEAAKPEPPESKEPTISPQAEPTPPVDTQATLVNVEIKKEVSDVDTPVEDADSCDSEYEDEGDDEYQSDTAGSMASAHSSASNSSVKKKKTKKKTLSIPTRATKKKKVKRAKKSFERHHRREHMIGDTLPVEIIHTQSVAEVMWQDGHIETNISSTDLFPIHHLDELEFFPGDFVLPLSDGAVPDKYGVVESVDHAGRTCMVKWIKPYQVGRATKPDESIVSEEVSVYDVKDHPDYKFRPGNVVVRVGGYVGSPVQAAGQVYELRQDGSITIQWVDKSRSQCYPQELYLLGDELSDLNDSDLESDTEDEDSDGDDSSSDSDDNSWQTEEEEEAEEGAESDGEKDGNDDKEGEDKLCVGPEKKVELDQLLETAKTTLKKLEDTFSQNIQIGCCTIHCYKEMLHIFRHCRYLDRLLSSQYFENADLLDVIANIKQELKKERAAKLARQVSEKYESNRSQVQEAAVAKASGDASSSVQPTPSCADKQTGEETVSEGASANMADATTLTQCDDPPRCDADLKTVSKGASANMADATTLTQCDDLQRCDAEVSTEEDVSTQPTQPKDISNFHKVATLALDMVGTSVQSVQYELERRSLLHEIEDLRRQIAEVGLSGVKCQESTGTQTACTVDKPSGDSKMDCDKSVQTETHALDSEAAELKFTCDKAVGTECQVKLLCQQACHLVAGQIVKVQNDLEEKWQVLKQAGKLRVLEEEEEQQEDAEAEKDAAAMSASQGAENTSTSAATPDARPGGTDKSQLKLDLDSATASPEAFLLKSPVTPQTPAEVKAKLEFNKDGFAMLESVPSNHKFKSTEHSPSDLKSFCTAVKKELKLLHTSLPKGIFVKGYEDRMDLLTVMIVGPTNTPYEDGLFFFDVQLPNDYPNNPPVLHFHSFCNERLNPNLYEDGKVCVSLLGTWTGKGTEVWTSKSSLMQVLISIQALILVSEPYYNEAGYEKQKGSQQGSENSRMYNEMAILKLVQAMTKTVQSPPVVFTTEVENHMKETAERMITRLEGWIEGSQSPEGGTGTSTSEKAGEFQACAPDASLSDGSISSTDFPLLPVSRGFKLTLRKYLDRFVAALREKGLVDSPSS